MDVGGAYDPNKRRYDHHQRGFDEAFGNGFNTKLSSAGLIYKLVHSIFYSDFIFIVTWICPRHFGKEIIARLMGYEESDERVQTLWLKLYKVLYVLD